MERQRPRSQPLHLTRRALIFLYTSIIIILACRQGLPVSLEEQYRDAKKKPASTTALGSEASPPVEHLVYLALHARSEHQPPLLDLPNSHQQFMHVSRRVESGLH